MSDIVERLRFAAQYHGVVLALEAADEIERLRAALAPFADRARYIDKHCPDAPDSDETSVWIHELREARAVLDAK
jgi:hypothetical protein